MLKIIAKVAVSVTLLTFLFSCKSTFLTQSQTSSPYHEFIHSGDTLPISNIVNVDGKQVDLQRSDKKKLVILFATWCHDSNNLLNALNSSPLLDDKRIEVIAIARGEDKATVKAWRDAHNIKVPLAVDEDRSIYKQFSTGGIPRIITVAKNNEIIQMNLAEGSKQLAKIVW
jgi:peroxiredoxin